MNKFEAIKTGLDLSHHILTSYLSDFYDNELLERPLEGANHSAWQLGHLISSEYQMMEAIKPGASPVLPDGFTAKYTNETSISDNVEDFETKDTYISLMNAQREATLEILEGLSEEDYDKDGPESVRAFCPTVGNAMVLQGVHQLMHAGQIAVMRRKLGKPVLM